MEPGNAGLSNFGHQVVERLNAERLVVDLSHGSPRTTSEAIRASKAPVLIGHTGCRALSDLPRNVGDAELRALAEKGGVAGIIFWPYLRVDTQPMAIDVIRHLEHAIKVCGEDHVGIGSDVPFFHVDDADLAEMKQAAEKRKADGIAAPGEDRPTYIPDLNTPRKMDLIADALLKRGHKAAAVEKILGANFRRVFGEIWS